MTANPRPGIAESAEESVQEIRQIYDEIEGMSNLHSKTFEFACEDDPDNGSMVVSRDVEGGLRKIFLKRSPGDHDGYETLYYYADDDVAFVFEKAFSWKFDGTNADGSSRSRETLRERRYYFRAKQCVRLLERTLESDDAAKLDTAITKVKNMEVSPTDAARVLDEGRMLRGIGDAGELRVHFCTTP